MEVLLDLIYEKIKDKTKNNSILINKRHKKIIENTIALLYLVKEELKNDIFQEEIVSEYVRSAISQLDLLVGKINVEDVLNSVFSSFCIGK